MTQAKAINDNLSNHPFTKKKTEIDPNPFSLHQIRLKTFSWFFFLKRNLSKTHVGVFNTYSERDW